jgi:hypothetical protein
MEDMKHGAELCDQITAEIDSALADNAAQMALFGLAKVTEMPRHMQATEHDPFIDDLKTDPNQGELWQ